MSNIVGYKVSGKKKKAKPSNRRLSHEWQPETLCRFLRENQTPNPGRSEKITLRYGRARRNGKTWFYRMRSTLGKCKSSDTPFLICTEFPMGGGFIRLHVDRGWGRQMDRWTHGVMPGPWSVPCVQKLRLVLHTQTKMSDQVG